MKLWTKRIAAALLIIAGVILFARHAKQLLNWPHLYPDLGQLGTGNLLFLGLTLFFVAFAWIAASYLLLNAKERVPHLLIPAAAFVILMTLGGLCLTRAVGEIPCTYTASVASYREDFDPEDFRVRGKSIYPGYALGELSGYARYEKGDTLAETVTRSYDQDGFVNESARLETLGLPAFRFVQDPREKEATCYQLTLGDTLWQVVLIPKTKTVTYSRFNRPDQLPSFAPQPMEEASINS